LLRSKPLNATTSQTCRKAERPTLPAVPASRHEADKLRACPTCRCATD
jgi:hypothetical protein